MKLRIWKPNKIDCKNILKIMKINNQKIPRKINKIYNWTLPKSLNNNNLSCKHANKILKSIM